MTHKSILIAIDSSDEAGEVIRAAKDIAGDSGAALSLITVITPVAYAYGPEYGMMAASTVNIEKEAAEFAKKNQNEIEKKFEIQCGKSVVIGQSLMKSDCDQWVRAHAKVSDNIDSMIAHHYA